MLDQFEELLVKLMLTVLYFQRILWVHCAELEQVLVTINRLALEHKGKDRLFLRKGGRLLAFIDMDFVQMGGMVLLLLMLCESLQHLSFL